MILGVAGPYAAGKGVVVEFLRARSFEAFSLSDVIRDELSARGMEETRERMIETGNEIRTKEGAGALAARVLSRLPKDRNSVVDSIRHPSEVEELRNLGPRFSLLWVDAPEELRFVRLRERSRHGDPATREELQALEGRELGSADPAAQQLHAVRDLADHVLVNDGDLESFHTKVQELLRGNMGFERPSWDQYFMSIAHVAATRSNCVKRKVAAVITRDRRIISTGYNGTPRGARNCNEGGCPRCASFGHHGVDLGECLCSHGEENAITQAAYHGVSVRGGTIYTTLCPCLLCTKMIINAGLREVVYNVEYPMGDVSLALLKEAGVSVRQQKA